MFKNNLNSQRKKKRNTNYSFIESFKFELDIARIKPLSRNLKHIEFPIHNDTLNPS